MEEEVVKKKRRTRKRFIRKVVCRVCGDVANDHIHYGAIACYSCRAFFRRYRCSRDGTCSVTRLTRKHCQACRYNACLSAGMQPGWVMTEEEKRDKKQKALQRKMEARRKLKRKEQDRLEQQQHLDRDGPKRKQAKVVKSDTRLEEVDPHAMDTFGFDVPPWQVDTSYPLQSTLYHYHGHPPHRQQQCFLEYQQHPSPSSPSSAYSYRPTPSPPSPSYTYSTAPDSPSSPVPYIYLHPEAGRYNGLTLPFTTEEGGLLRHLLGQESSAKHHLPVSQSTMSAMLVAARSGKPLPYQATVDGLSVCIGRIKEFVNSCEPFLALSAQDRDRLFRANAHAVVNIKTSRMLRPGNSLQRQLSCATGDGEGASTQEEGAASLQQRPNRLLVQEQQQEQDVREQQHRFQELDLDRLPSEILSDGKEGRGGPKRGAQNVMAVASSSSGNNKGRIDYSQVFRSPWCWNEEREENFRSLMEDLFKLEMDDVTAVLLVIITMLSPPAQQQQQHQKPEQGDLSQDKDDLSSSKCSSEDDTRDLEMLQQSPAATEGEVATSSSTSWSSSSPLDDPGSVNLLQDSYSRMLHRYLRELVGSQRASLVFPEYIRVLGKLADMAAILQRESLRF